MKYKTIYSISLLAMLVVISFISLILGNIEISKEDIWKIITLQFDELPDFLYTIIIDIRLPRIIMAIVIGMMLASSGVITQTIFQNPLADPFIIGIAAAATFGAVLAYLLGVGQGFYGIFAFVSCSIMSLIIFQISKVGFKSDISRLLMIGIALSAFLGAFTSFATYLIGEDSFRIILWTMGYLGYANFTTVMIVIPVLIISFVYFFMNRHKLDLILSGDEEANAMGIDVHSFKRKMLIVSSMVVGFSVAFTGMIGFVGLIIPHCIRLIAGASNTHLIPMSALLGAIFLLACDTISRKVIAPVEIPIGVVTSFFGAPFFIYLAMKRVKN